MAIINHSYREIDLRLMINVSKHDSKQGCENRESASDKTPSRVQIQETRKVMNSILLGDCK